MKIEYDRAYLSEIQLHGRTLNALQQKLRALQNPSLPLYLTRIRKGKCVGMYVRKTVAFRPETLL